MATAFDFTEYKNFLTDSSSAMAVYGYPFEQKLQNSKDLTAGNYGLNISLDRSTGSVIFPENLMEPLDTFKMPDRLTNQFYGKDILNTWINDKAKNAPSIEKIREITAKVPSLTKLLLDDRNNE